MFQFTEKQLKKIRSNIHANRVRKPNSEAKVTQHITDSKGSKYVRFSNGRVEKVAHFADLS